MKSINRFITFFICYCSVLYTLAQPASYSIATKQEIMAAYEQGCSWFINTPSYFFKIRYSSFKNHFSSEKIETSEGYYKRVANNLISEVLGIKTVQNSIWKTIVDTSDKIVTVLNSGNLKPTMTNRDELETFLISTKSLKKVKLEKGTLYRIEFDKNELYNAYEFILSNKGYIEGLTYYYGEQVHKNYDNEDSEGKQISMSPRLEIRFLGFEVPAKYSEVEFSLNNINVKAKGEIHLTGIYKDYRLLDYRLQTGK